MAERVKTKNNGQKIKSLYCTGLAAMILNYLQVFLIQTLCKLKTYWILFFKQSMSNQKGYAPFMLFAVNDFSSPISILEALFIKKDQHLSM